MRLEKRFLERLAASAVREGLTDVVYGSVETRFGRLLVAQSDSGVCRVSFQEESDGNVLSELAYGIGPRVVESATATAEVREALEAYVSGELLSFDFPIDYRLVRSDFQRRVLRRLRRVPRGKVMTYGEIAEAVGRPRAARAAGTACARNPIPLIVPCHRIVPADRTVGRYGGGPWRKKFLLELEGADVRS